MTVPRQTSVHDTHVSDRFPSGVTEYHAASSMRRTKQGVRRSKHRVVRCFLFQAWLTHIFFKEKPEVAQRTYNHTHICPIILLSSSCLQSDNAQHEL